MDFITEKVYRQSETPINAEEGSLWLDTDEEAAVSGGGGSASIDVTAEVGQTIIVEEVDENGKPTKWKAVEYQPRTHYEETVVNEVEYFAEQVLTFTTNGSGKNLITVDNPSGENLVLGDKYIVIFDGERYECVAKEPGYNIGNLALVSDTYENTGEPFRVGGMNLGRKLQFFAETPGEHTISIYKVFEETIVHKVPDKFLHTPDWNASEGEPGHVLNRTHWVESEHKVLLDTTVTTSQSMAALQQKMELQEGQTCIVTFGGQQYSCTCRYLAYMGFLSLAIGNTYPIDGNNTGEPFMVMYAPLMNVTYVVIMLPDGEHSIKVEGEVKSYHTIPSVFLPKPCWMIEFDLDNPSTDVTRIELDKAIDNGEMIALRGRRYVNATVILYYFEYRDQSGVCTFCDANGRNRITLTPNASGGYDMTEGTA